MKRSTSIGGGILAFLFAALAGFIPAWNLEPINAHAVEAELPRVYIDTTMPDTLTYSVVNVSAGYNLQEAIDNASCGTVLRLEAGATYSGSFVLRKKNCDGRWIIISSSAESQLPPGQRVNPSQANLMAKVVSPNGLNVFFNEPGASFYRFTGLEITTVSPWLNNLVYLDSFTPNFSDVPHHIIFDRVYIHGSPTGNIRRGFGFNVREGSIIDSYISDIHQEGFDSQAVGCWGCPGPLKIVNNYLEAASENIAFGGAKASVDQTVPSDIEIRGNYFYKPLSWRSTDPSFAGTTWLAKNLFESKNSQRVLIEGNVFENSWAEAQAGWAFVLPTRTSDSSPASVTQDYTVRNNIIRHVGGGVSILGYDTSDPNWPTGVIKTKKLTFRNNIWEDMDPAKWGGNGEILQVLAGVEDLTLDHNTIFNTGSGPIGFSNDFVVISNNFVVTNNLMNLADYGVSGWGVGKPTLDYMTRNYSFTKNVLLNNQWNAVYPDGNYFPVTWDEVLFTDFNGGIGGDYTLAASSPYRNAGTDGKDLGADIPAVMYATRGAVSGMWNVDASLSPVSQSFAAAGGSGTVTVTSFTGGSWNALSNSSWISVTSGASGSGNGRVGYSVSANAAASPRSGTITIAGQTFTVTEEANSCTFSISPAEQSFSSGELTGEVNVAADGGCSWSAASDSTWITILSGKNGTGKGTVQFKVATNLDTEARTGSLTVAGKPFAVKQAGSSGVGVIAVAPMSIDFGRVRGGETASQQIKITNKGTGPLKIRGISFISRTLGVFSHDGACETLAAGESCNLSVKFTPPYRGLIQGIMKIYSNASNGKGVQVKLRGTGN